MYKSTVYTILGILAMEPMSGYEIKKVIDDSTKYFWNESQGQIYPSLKLALAEDLIAVHQQADVRSKVSYSITDKGRLALKDWLEQTPGKFTIRNELLLKVFFGNNADQQTIINYLEENISKLQMKLRTYTHIKKEIEKEMQNGEPGGKYWYVTVEYGIRSIQSEIGWSRDSIEFIKQN